MALPKILLYYVFTPLPDPDAIRVWQRDLCASLGLRGRILISPHGINATVGGELDAVKKYVRATRDYAPFAGADFKWSRGSGLTAEPGSSGYRESVDFPKLSVKVRDEIVTFGAPDELEVDDSGVVGGGARLSPAGLHELIEQRGDDVVLLDGRNAFEAQVGRFEGAVVPDVTTTADFLARLEDGSLDDLKGRPVVTYCTGGIRCEVLTTLMRARGFEDVYQLDGGIVRYGETYGNTGLWKGSLYVFDGRSTIDFGRTAEVIGRCDTCGTATNALVTLDLEPGRRIQVVRCAGCHPAAGAAAD